MKIQVRTRLRVTLNKYDIDLAVGQGDQRLPRESRIIHFYTKFFNQEPWEGILKPITCNGSADGDNEKFFILFASEEK